MMATDAPKRIWLQYREGEDWPPDTWADPIDDGVTWCWHPVGEADIEYVHAAREAELVEALERVLKIADRGELGHSEWEFYIKAYALLAQTPEGAAPDGSRYKDATASLAESGSTAARTATAGAGVRDPSGTPLTEHERRECEAFLRCLRRGWDVETDVDHGPTVVVPLPEDPADDAYDWGRFGAPTLHEAYEKARHTIEGGE